MWEWPPWEKESFSGLLQAERKGPRVWKHGAPHWVYTEFGEDIHPGILPIMAKVGSFILWRERNVGVLGMGFHIVWSRSLIFHIEVLPWPPRRHLQSGCSVMNPGGFGITLGSRSRLDWKSSQPLEVRRGWDANTIGHFGEKWCEPYWAPEVSTAGSPGWEAERSPSQSTCPTEGALEICVSCHLSLLELVPDRSLQSALH